MGSRKILQIVVLAIVVGLLAFFALGLKSNFNKIEKGDQAFLFEADNMDKKKVNLNDYKGQVIVLNFFTSWCDPCRDEVYELEEFNKEVKDSGKAVFFIVDRGETQKHVQKFIDEFDTKSEYLFDYNHSISEKYGVVGQPETLIIDKKGVLREHLLGPTTTQELLFLVDKYNK
ncbi:MAG: alkyl hydroperoxide reductase [Bacillales bacterium]|jgi:peroxiredoxin|nr:alkyl hydroperoxide reductase [Bacillales bacterium]